MRSKFSLTLALSVVLLTVLGVSAQTYWERNDKKSDRQTRKKTSVSTIGRQNRVIVVTPNQVVVRPAIRSNIRPVKVRPITPSYSYSRYESNSDGKRGRVYESERYGGGVAEVARLNGYRDGVREGAKDAADGDRYDPFGEHAYKDGATGYISKYRNRGDYQRFYRQSFVRGYKESFDRYLGNYERRNW